MPEAEAEAEGTETITVTGIRASIQDSLAAKRNSSSIVEAISAEDIGKLPDLSIADSLARLPGVTAQRVRGRAQQISIRGLGPDFSIALLNGREQISAGQNRGIEFDQFPSELISQALVYKTPDATLAATGIAGAVDLRTVRPLSFRDRQVNISGRYVLNDQDQRNPDFEEDGYRFFGSYIDQNDDGTIGWALSATVQSNPTQYLSRELKTNQFQVTQDADTGLFYPSDNPRTGVVSREFERTSFAGTLEFQPNDRWQTTIDGFFTDTEDTGIFRGLETPIASWSGAQFVGATGSGPFAETSTFDQVVPILRTDTEGNSAEILSLGINSSYEVTDRFKVTGDFSRSTLDRDDIDYESYAGTGRARSGPQDTLTFVTPGSGEYSIQSTLDYTDPQLVLLTDPGGWGQVGFIKEPDIQDELQQLRLEAEYAVDAGPVSSIVAGYLRTDRDKEFDSNESFIRPTDDFGDLGLTIPGGSILGATDSGDIGLDIIAYDPDPFLTDGTYNLEKALFDVEWTIDEAIDTFYAMVNLDTTVFNFPMTGNVGFQYQEVEQSSTANLQRAGDVGTRQDQTLGDEYSHFLPSANFSFEVRPDTFLRFAAAQTVTRPRLDDLAANQNITINPVVCTDADNDFVPDAVAGFDPPANTCFNIGGGNPELRPYEATSFDVSFERYFTSTSALSIAVFHKELDEYVERVAQITDIDAQLSDIGIADLDAFLAANPDLTLARADFPQNFGEGSITGIELTLRADLADLNERLDGFGFSASYTYADNELEDQNGNVTPIPGYSETVWSGDVYYEKFGWRARLSARHRSEFLSEVQNFDGTLSGADALEETILDAQIGYEFDAGPFEGFSVLFEAFNITDEPFATENDLDGDGPGTATFPSRHELYGTTYNVTVSKRF